MKDYILEVCADSVESVLAAEEGGATRVELCQNLVIGGTTPGPKFFEEVRRHSKIRIHALIRPRFGDFCYTDYEYAVIREEVKMYRELGAEGVVIGILKPDGTLNMEQMEGLMEEAKGMSVTLHRAFDVCADPFAALECGKAGDRHDPDLRAAKQLPGRGGTSAGTGETERRKDLHSGRRRRECGSDRKACSGCGDQSLAYVRKGDAGQ